MYKSIRALRQRSQSRSSLCRTHTAHSEICDKETLSRGHAGTTCFISALVHWHSISVWLFLRYRSSTLKQFLPGKDSNHDPDYTTAGIKAKLRRNNRLMHAGRVAEADALAVRISKHITSRTLTLESYWLKGQHQGHVGSISPADWQINVVDGITAEWLNKHYAAISTDTSYQLSPRKRTVTPNVTEVSEWRMFHILDNLCTIAAWFLRLAPHCSTSRW